MGRKLPARRQGDRVLGQPIEGAITGNVTYRGTRVVEDRVRAFVPLPLGQHWRHRCRPQAINLRGVEDHDGPNPRLLVAHHPVHLFAVLVQHRFAIRIADRLDAPPLPELDRGALLAFANLRVLALRLAVGHPPRIRITV
jgi:hypothetical protein